MTSPSPLSPAMQAALDEAGPGAWFAYGHEIDTDDETLEWRHRGGNFGRGEPGVSHTYLVRRRRRTVEVPVDLLERLIADGWVAPADDDEARRLIDEARSDTSGGA